MPGDAIGLRLTGSSSWDNGAATDAGAITWSYDASRLTGPISAGYSVRGGTAGGGADLSFEYDPVNYQLVVGRPADNIVTLFKIVFGLAVDPPAAAKSGLPGSTVSYMRTIANTGDIAETYHLAAGGGA